MLRREIQQPACVFHRLQPGHYDRSLEAISLKDRPQQRRQDFRSEVLVGIDAQVSPTRDLEDETQAAAETARRLHEEQLLAIGQRQRQIALRKQVAQIGGRFHPPR